MGVVERVLDGLTMDGAVADVRVGPLWTAVVVSTNAGLRCGLASTQIVHDLEHGQPAVRDAGRLIGRTAAEVAALSLSNSLAERSIGFAALNALVDVDEARCIERNAEEIILERLQDLDAPNRTLAIVGHFPFVPRMRVAARDCWVLELHPTEGDLPAGQAPEIIPRASVVAITGMTLVNGTFEALAALCRPDATVLVLGATTPLSPVLFDFGVDAISGTVVRDIPAVLAAVSQGANFRQISGKRLVTMLAL